MNKLLRTTTVLSAIVLATVSVRAADVSSGASSYYNPYPNQPSGYVLNGCLRRAGQSRLNIFSQRSHLKRLMPTELQPDYQFL
jgi:hypothetical protein